MEECRLRVFKNRVLRRIFGPKKDDITGEWRRLHNVELYDLYCSPNIQVIKSRRMRWAWNVACMRDRRGVYSILVGSLEERETTRKPRHGWPDCINMDHQEVLRGGKH